MSSETLYEIHIVVHPPHHSTAIAAVLLSNTYSQPLQTSLELKHPYPEFVLKPDIPGDTAIATLGVPLQEQHHIPLAVQQGFHPDTMVGKLSRDKLEDFNALTVRQAWEVSDIPDKEILYLILLTTAGRLRDIIDLGEWGSSPGGDGIFHLLLDWRHYVGALSYLQRKKSHCASPKEVEALDAEAARCLAMEQSKAQKLRRMFMEWDEFINGVPSSPVRQSTNESKEAREQDIERRFEAWLIEKKSRVAEGVAKFKERKALETTRTIRAGVAETKPTLVQVIERENCQGQSDTSESSSSASLLPTDRHLAADLPKNSEGVFSRSMRIESGELEPDLGSFMLRSGVLLWGHIHTVFAGHISTVFQGNADTLSDLSQGGTILQRALRYRSAARIGSWNVRKTFSIPYPGTEGDPTEHFGWIVFHEDVRPMEILDRCSRIVPGPSAISNLNDHVDRVSVFSYRRCGNLISIDVATPISQY